MEYDWERTFAFLKVEKAEVSKLFEGILEEKDIINLIPINEGCRTTNYIVQTNEINKYILKIFLSNDQKHKKEIKLLSKLSTSRFIPVPKIYKFSSHGIIRGKEYVIYKYIDGKTVGQAIREGYSMDESLVREAARALAEIHSYKFNKAGFFNENLDIEEELPPVNLWYEISMGDRVKKRLGKINVDKINHIVRQNEKILTKLDEDIRLVHGDFQGTNILIDDDKLAGIIDWEFAMAGHPLADIGQFFRYEECFDKSLIQVFEEEYNKNSTYKLTDDWYKISKLRDLINLIQLMDTNEDMPNKHMNIKKIIVDILEQF